MNKIISSLAVIAALALSAPVLAQQKAPDSKTAVPAKVAIPRDVFYKGLGPTQYLAASKLIGQIVYAKDGQQIGDIEDIILGAKDNSIDGVIIGAGGVLNVGDKKVGVRYAALKFETKDGKTVISLPNVTNEMIAALEPYHGARTLLQKAGEAAKSAAQTASDAAKTGYDKAKDAIKGSPAPAEQKK